MPRIMTTSRSDLRDGSGVNTHFCFNPSVYANGSSPRPDIVQAVIDLGAGYVRERWWPKNTAQQAAFATLADAGVGFYLFIGDMSSTPAQAQSDAAALAASPIAASVVAVCGPNEPNGNGGNSWPAKVVALQQAIYTEVTRDKSLSDASIVGPALMHNVANLDADYIALASAGVSRWCNAGDFHFYPGNAGPFHNADEAARAAEAYGALPLWQSETGWTGSDTDPTTAARFSVEALLRNHLTGICGTMLYELADESQYVAGREGLFGLRTPTKPKPGYSAVQTLLATNDGKEDFVGTLGTYKGQAPDVEVVVTSEGAGNWTVYLLRESQPTAYLVLPSGYVCDTGTSAPGDGGGTRYTIQLSDTMTTAHVSPASAHAN